MAGTSYSRAQVSLRAFRAERVDPALSELRQGLEPRIARFDEIRRQATPALDRVRARIEPAFVELDESCQSFIQKHIDPLFGAERDRQMKTLVGTRGGMEIGEFEKMVNRHLAVSVLLLATTTAGSAVLPVLSPLCLPIGLWLTWPYAQRAYRGLVRKRRIDLNAQATVTLLATWLGGFYLVGSVALVISLCSRKMLLMTEDRSRQGLVDIFGQQPRSVWVLAGESEVEIPFERLQVGDTVVLTAGQTIPIDGSITHGHASIDQHRLTGEAQPAEKGPGDRVLAATLVLTGKIHVLVEQAGQETVAMQIGKTLSQTGSYQLEIEAKAIRFANGWVVPTLLTAGLADLLVGYQGAVAITAASFGSNAKLTGSLSMLNFLNVATRRGILVKDSRSFELLNEIDTVIFDKTGTLTMEQPHVTEIHVFGELPEETLLLYAAAVERRQSHPIARAVLDAAESRGLLPPDIADLHYEAGYGIHAHIDGRLIHLGSDRYMALENIALSPAARECVDARHSLGHSMVMLAVDGQLAGAIELEPTVRPEVRAVIEELHRRSLRLYILSGDQEAPTRKLAEHLGIDRYFANTLPGNKAAIVERLQAEGRSVCFVGDGINDAIALKKAKVSVSLRGATSVATDSAQIVLMNADLQLLPTLFELGHAFDRNLKAGFAASIIPGVAIFGGVFFFHRGILGAFVIDTVSILAGLQIALSPLLAENRNGDKRPSVPAGPARPA